MPAIAVAVHEAGPESALLTKLTTQVARGDIADVLPPAVLLQILRGLAIGLALSDAVPRRSRRVPDSATTDLDRRVLLDAVAALIRDMPRSTVLSRT